VPSFGITGLTFSDPNLPPAEIKAKIESIARISPSDEPPFDPPQSPVIPPHHPHSGQQAKTIAPSATSTKTANEASLISFDDDDSDEFVDAHE